ncbi:MAG: Uma2 family endonuclease [Acidobacteria bacterium]|nr:Uma2 family endonuclease [Acidobacteriota bacterium]
MEAKTQISVEEYLETSFDGPDCDYVDGEIVERNVGENPHSKAQVNLVGFFFNLPKELCLHVRTELRMRVALRRFRIADVAVFAGEEPAEYVPSSPPLVAIEILSRKDQYAEIMAKFDDYRNWGVAHIWFVDPWLRRIHVYAPGSLQEVTAFQLPEYGVEIPASVVFE